jgi:hypothetical protein
MRLRTSLVRLDYVGKKRISLYDDDKVLHSRTDTLLNIVPGTKNKEEKKNPTIENTQTDLLASNGFYPLQSPA